MGNVRFLAVESMTKRDKWVLGIVLGGLVVVIALASCFVFFILNSPDGWSVTRPFDNMFGDQHLKTTVALLELYKLRHGSYPDRLADLDFMGDWDRIILWTVAYYPSSDRSGYYVEVTRGWVARPRLTYPPEFWRGTGYRAELRPR